MNGPETTNEYPVITRSVLSVDGYERLELSKYDQEATTIDVVSGSHDSDLNPPLFKDNSLVSTDIQTMSPWTSIILPNPSKPERVPYFKVVGEENIDLAERLNFTVTAKD